MISRGGAEAQRNLFLMFAEIVAVVLNLLYTYLYLHNNPVCFWMGGMGSAIFVWLCFAKKLFAESFLQLFYVVMAVYGFIHFGGEWRTVHTAFSDHVFWLAGGLFLVAASGFFLKQFTRQKMPYVDSFTTVFGIIATWHMVNFVHENWLYWLVINTVSIFMYAKRGMYIASLMFVLYLLMSVDGYFELNWF